MSAAELPKAAAKGDLRAVRQMLKSGVPPNSKGGHGWTGLHFAAKGGHAAVIGSLLKAKANPELKTPDGLTPLHVAAMSGHAAAVSALLEGGAAVDSLSAKQLSPLLMAAEAGHGEAAAALLAGGADAAASAPRGGLPMNIAVTKGHSTVVAALVAAGGATAANGTTPEGLSWLQLAALNGQAKVISALAAGGADVNATDSKGDTALHTLVQHWKNSKALPGGKSDGKGEQYTAAAKALLDAGADPWLIDNMGKSPLMLSSDRGNTRLQQMFIAASPSPGSAERAKKSPRSEPPEQKQEPALDLTSKIAAASSPPATPQAATPAPAAEPPSSGPGAVSRSSSLSKDTQASKTTKPSATTTPNSSRTVPRVASLGRSTSSSFKKDAESGAKEPAARALPLGSSARIQAGASASPSSARVARPGASTSIPSAASRVGTNSISSTSSRRMVPPSEETGAVTPKAAAGINRTRSANSTSSSIGGPTRVPSRLGTTPSQKGLAGGTSAASSASRSASRISSSTSGRAGGSDLLRTGSRSEVDKKPSTSTQPQSRTGQAKPASSNPAASGATGAATGPSVGSLVDKAPASERISDGETAAPPDVTVPASDLAQRDGKEVDEHTSDMDNVGVDEVSASRASEEAAAMSAASHSSGRQNGVASGGDGLKERDDPGAANPVEESEKPSAVEMAEGEGVSRGGSSGEGNDLAERWSEKEKAAGVEEVEDLKAAGASLGQPGIVSGEAVAVMEAGEDSLKEQAVKEVEMTVPGKTAEVERPAVAGEPALAPADLAGHADEGQVHRIEKATAVVPAESAVLRPQSAPPPAAAGKSPVVRAEVDRSTSKQGCSCVVM